MERILEQINSPDDLKGLPAAKLPQLAGELREEIVRAVSKTGGHLGSSLGVVELTIALHRVFNSPVDRIIWDVGHQAYAHKMLTGRREAFSGLRQFKGLSGFPKRSESPHDVADVGHSSTSISTALGMAVARDLAGGEEKIVAVIGDGSMTAGMAFEALNHAGHVRKNLTVILNDNDMSISPNVGALASFLGRKTSSDLYIRMKREIEGFLGHFPHFGKDIVTALRRTKNLVKGILTPGMLFEAFGFHYYGPIDGHNLDELLETLNNVSQINGPVLVHVLTTKGKGYRPAEEHPACFHGVGVFDPDNGVRQSGTGGPPGYTEVFGQTLTRMAEKDARIVAITAAMMEGTGLTPFAKAHPERFFDVGIAEQHAVTFASGLALRGMRPVTTIYSSFLQRAYDQVLHDVCLQNLPVTFALDRGGLVGADGPTHHGVYDLSYLRHIPNMCLMVPRNEAELMHAMATAAGHEGPIAYRYPRGAGVGVPLPGEGRPVPVGQGELLREGSDVAVVGVGPILHDILTIADELAAEGISVAVVDGRFVKPLDDTLILRTVRGCRALLTVEENAVQGGFGSAVLELLKRHDIFLPVRCVGIPDSFIEQGGQKDLRKICGLDPASLKQQLMTLAKS